MSVLNSFIKSFVILVTFVFILVGTVYLLIIIKPESIIFLTNKLLNEDYSIQFKEAKSDTNFLSPIVVLNDVYMMDIYENEIFKADELKIGIKILKSILDGHLHLNALSLINIDFKNQSISQGNNRTYKFKISNIYISSEQFTFSSDEIQILSREGDLSI